MNLDAPEHQPSTVPPPEILMARANDAFSGIHKNIKLIEATMLRLLLAVENAAAMARGEINEKKREKNERARKNNRRNRKTSTQKAAK